MRAAIGGSAGSGSGGSGRGDPGKAVPIVVLDKSNSDKGLPPVNAWKKVRPRKEEQRGEEGGRKCRCSHRPSAHPSIYLFNQSIGQSFHTIRYYG